MLTMTPEYGPAPYSIDVGGDSARGCRVAIRSTQRMEFTSITPHTWRQPQADVDAVILRAAQGLRERLAPHEAEEGRAEA